MYVQRCKAVVSGMHTALQGSRVTSQYDDFVPVSSAMSVYPQVGWNGAVHPNQLIIFGQAGAYQHDTARTNSEIVPVLSK